MSLNPPELKEPPPEHCPGPQTESAGKAEACQGCPNQSICQSAPKGPDPDLESIQIRMKPVKNKLLVLSGKGGVGKSTFSSQLANKFARWNEEKEVGLLDIDICGPSIPRLLGCSTEQIHKSNAGWSPVYTQDNLAVMSIGFMLNSPSDAVIWRGPKKNGLIKQFLKDVNWGELDYLVIDTPPGTSDEHLSIAQYLTNATDKSTVNAIVVTTPQEVSLLDVRKEINFCKKVGVNIIGVVENMSGFVCPKCKNETQVFPATTGGAEKMCQEMGIPFLGKIPLDPRIAKACDQGQFSVDLFPDSPATASFNSIFEKIVKSIPSQD